VDGPIGTTLMVATLAFSVLFVYVASERYRLRKQEDEVMALRRVISLQPSRPGSFPKTASGAPSGSA
jgi:cell division protein FtsL